MFKKLALVAMIAGASVSTSAVAQATNWGEVAGGTELNTSTAPATQTSETEAWGSAPPASENVAAAIPDAASAKPGCGDDDDRYAGLVPILRGIQAGKEVEPLQTSFSTYVGLNAKIRNILGDNIVISSPDCSEQFIFEGVLTGKVSVPFADQWNVINDALRTGDQGLLRFILDNTKTAPASALTVISLAQFAPLDEGQLKKFYAVTAPAKANKKELAPPLMLDLFLQFGGTVEEAERGMMAYVARGFNSRDRTTLYAIHLENGAGSVAHQLSVEGANIPNQIASLLTATGLKSTVMADNDAQKASEATAQ